MNKSNERRESFSSSGINWQQVKDNLPKTSWELLDSVKNAYEADQSDPARGVELTLRGKIAELKNRFEILKAENQNEREPKVLAPRKNKR